MNERPVAIQVEHVSKVYRLGVINHATFRDEMKAAFAKMLGREDPTQRIGQHTKHIEGSFLRALDDVSLTVYKGESLGIIGANGAGKSTLLKLICRITSPTEGTIGINGRISSMLEVGIGFMPELTGRENIYISGAILGMSRREVDEKLDAIAEFSECSEFLDTPLKRYSSGMRVKLGFSIAAHLSNEIMIMDEVLAVGDLRFQKKCLDRMSEAATQEGKTVLYVSHNMNTIRQLCSRCVVLDEGKLIYDGETEKAIALYSDQFATMSCNVDLDRCSHYPRAIGGLRMMHAQVLDREIAVFQRGEKINLVLIWKAECDLESVLPLFHLYTKDGLALAWLQADPLTNIKAGRTYQTKFEVDVGNLAIGEYSIMYIMADSVKGRGVIYDGVQDGLVFEIVDHNVHDYFSVWRRSLDGFFVNPDGLKWYENTEV